MRKPKKDIEWFLKEIIAEHISALLNIYISVVYSDELDQKVDELINFVLNHLDEKYLQKEEEREYRIKRG